MELLLSEQQGLLRDAAAKLGASKGGPRRARRLRDAGVGIDQDAWGEMMQAGWPAILLEERHGGSELGALDLALLAEEAGKQLLMTPLVEAASAAWLIGKASGPTVPEWVEPFAKPSTPSLTPTVLRDVTSGARLVDPAMSSPHWQSGDAAPSPRSIPAARRCQARCRSVPICRCGRPAARRGGRAWRRNGPLPGAAIRRRRRPRDHRQCGRLPVEPRVVPGTSLPGRLGRAGRRARPAGGAAARAARARHGGRAHRRDPGGARDNARLSQDAPQFGGPIGSFQALQHRAVDLWIDLELTRALIYRVLVPSTRRANIAMTSAARRACRAARSRRCSAAVQLHGAIGYTDEHDIGLYYKRAVALAAKYGNEIMHVDRFSALTLPVPEAAG